MSPPKASAVARCSKLSASLLLALGLLLLCVVPAHAATVTVNSGADAPDANPGNGTCAAAAGVCTLRAAVMEANALTAAGAAGNVINLPAGTYTLSVAGRAEDGAVTGDLDLNGGTLEIKGAGPGTTIIDGNQLDRILHLGPVTPVQFSLEGVTIRNGNAISSPPVPNPNGPDVGGGIRIEKNSGLVVRTAILRNNRVGGRGGAIAGPPSAGIPAGANPAITTVLTDVTMEDNSAGVEGGATFNNRVAFFTRVIVRNNTVTGTDTTGPNVPRGAGIAQSDNLTLTDVIVTGNSMVAGSGGGIANRGDPVANIFGTLRLNRVTVSDNTSVQGGGIASGNGATAILTNTTVSGNRATASSGGFANLGPATLTNVTLSGNSAPAGAGGGIGTLGPPAGAANAGTTLRNTIVAGSTGGDCLPPPNPAFAQLPTSGGDNISSDNSCNLTGPGDRNGTDPLLGPLAANGGFTPTHALPAGSPAINAVRNNACPPPADDQRGAPRPQGPRCDIGAYERSVPPVVPPGPDPIPVPVPPFAGCPSSTANVIRGTAGGNHIIGTPGADRIFAGAGEDRVDGLGGNDCIDLGPGVDRGLGGLGNDLIRGGSRGDRISGGPGNDRLSGGSGGDLVEGGAGRDRVAGDSGNDLILGGSGNDILFGGRGSDRLKGGSGRDRINGGSGNDRIFARDGQRDRINCGAGRDTVFADRIDRISRNCERIRRTRSRA